MKSKIVLVLTLLALATLVPLQAMASSYDVFVGYADGLRGAGFFPSPWNGDPGVTFVGTTAPYDAGAVWIHNLSGASLTISDVSVNIPWGPGYTFDLWGSNTIAAGGSLILTETAHYNFDTSDYSGRPCGATAGPLDHPPTVTVTVGGTATTFKDSGHVLDTNGYDFACKGNESFAWRSIGTTGTPSGTAPEASSLLLMGVTGLLGMVGMLRRKLAK